MEAEALNIETPPRKLSSSIVRKASINDKPITKLNETCKNICVASFKFVNNYLLKASLSSSCIKPFINRIWCKLVFADLLRESC